MSEEAKIEAYLNTLVKRSNGHSRKLSYIGRRGCPDRLIMLNNGVYFVEVKAAKGVVSVHQEREMELLKSFGAEVLLLNSKAAVKKFIDRVIG